MPRLLFALFIIAACIADFSFALRLSRRVPLSPVKSAFYISKHANKKRQTNALTMTMDILYIPALIGTAAVVFGIFNIENPVDLTDSGRAKAKSKRRAERIARGEVFKPKEGHTTKRIRYKDFI